jgi:hypothetical protein
MQENKKDPKKDPAHEEGRNEYIPGVQEKTTLGGSYNTGVTSDDPEEKDEIEKKGSLANLKPKKQPSQQENQDTESTQ